ncbi:hyccin [Coccinella septempunctata]|uniref:hyccin n=1 Tax=Coccinella septempunctata TaxID=41139 RepID=UPI001D085CF7|nr:hyccin [Coccinella septempunctata]
MAEILVLEWMEEFEALTESEIHTYSAEQEHNHEIMIALFDVLSEPSKYKFDNMIDGICRQLLDFYRSGEKQLKRFTLQYIPILVFLHLGDKTISSIQTLLVSLYNLEIIDAKGQPKTLTFRLPSIAQSSIYHDATNLEPSFIAENSLRRWEECNNKLVSWGPLPQVECLNAQNRYRVLTALIFLYNQYLSSALQQGIECTCRVISRLVTQGFQNNRSGRNSANSDTDSVSAQSLTSTRRIPVTNTFLIELINIVHNAMQRGINAGQTALNDIIHRASYETYPDVLLAANAVKNLLQYSPTIAATPRVSHSHNVSKSMITNASFRTKKLPDDIPIQDEHHQDPLDSITEEQEETEKSKSKGSVSALKGHLPKLPGLSKKHKDKNKPSDVEMAAASGDMSELTMNNSEFGNTVHISAV